MISKSKPPTPFLVASSLLRSRPTPLLSLPYGHVALQRDSTAPLIALPVAPGDAEFSVTGSFVG